MAMKQEGRNRAKEKIKQTIGNLFLYELRLCVCCFICLIVEASTEAIAVISSLWLNQQENRLTSQYYNNHQHYFLQTKKNII